MLRLKEIPSLPAPPGPWPLPSLASLHAARNLEKSGLAVDSFPIELK